MREGNLSVMPRSGVEPNVVACKHMNRMQVGGVNRLAMQGGDVKRSTMKGGCVNWKQCKDLYIKESLEEKFFQTTLAIWVISITRSLKMNPVSSIALLN